MEITFSYISLISLVASVVGILSAIIIFYFGVKGNQANLPLAIGQLSIALGIFVSFSLVSKMILHWPFMYRLGHPFILIFIPMPYLHVIFYTRNRRWKWFDWLHAIPLLIFLVDYWHVLSLSNAEKLQILQQELNDLNVLGRFRQSKYFGPDFHQSFRTALFSVYWMAQVFILVKWLKGQPNLTPQNKVWKNWIMLFLGYQFFIWFPFYLSLFGLNIMTTYHIVNSFSIVWLLFSSLSMFFFPSLLYGKLYDNGTNFKTGFRKKTSLKEGEDKKLEEVMRVIEFQMDKNSFFLKPGYTINEFANDIELPVYQISKSINNLRGVSFVEYTNQKRIQYCISKFSQGEWLNLTLEAVALECGFSHRNSFTKMFKKFKNQSPSEYLRKLMDHSSH